MSVVAQGASSFPCCGRGPGHESGTGVKHLRLDVLATAVPRAAGQVCCLRKSGYQSWLLPLGCPRAPEGPEEGAGCKPTLFPKSSFVSIAPVHAHHHSSCMFCLEAGLVNSRSHHCLNAGCGPGITSSGPHCSLRRAFLLPFYRWGDRGTDGPSNQYTGRRWLPGLWLPISACQVCAHNQSALSWSTTVASGRPGLSSHLNPPYLLCLILPTLWDVSQGAEDQTACLKHKVPGPGPAQNELLSERELGIFSHSLHTFILAPVPRKEEKAGFTEHH